jgi:microsomal prostaglandin-E synthase 2
MWLAQGKIKKKYAIDDERQAVYGAIAHWVEQGVGGRAFAGGDAPNFADVCVFGCLKAIDRTDAFAEILAETEVGPWYDRMRERTQPGGACTSRQ